MTRSRMTCAVTIAVLAGLAVHMTAGAPQSQEKTSVPKVRVGTFDVFDDMANKPPQLAI